MIENGITKKITEYMKIHQIPMEQTAKDLRIDIQALQSGKKGSLSAGEFLDLCHYLNVKPEELK